MEVSRRHGWSKGLLQVLGLGTAVLAAGAAGMWVTGVSGREASASTPQMNSARPNDALIQESVSLPITGLRPADFHADKVRVSTASPGSTIDLGHVEAIANGAGPSVGPVSQFPGAGINAHPPRLVSLDQAAHSLDFSILLPTWLPTPNYRLGRVEQLDNEVILQYQDNDGGDVLVREQLISQAGSRYFAPAELQQGTVNGQVAALWTQGEGTPVGPIHQALWEQGNLLVGLSYRGTISPDDFLRIAESLSSG